VVEDWEKTWIKESKKGGEKEVEEEQEKKEEPRMKYDVMDILCYGPSNSGKTFFSCTCPEPIIILDTENRAYLTKRYQFPKKDIEVVELLEVKEEFQAKNLNQAIDIGGTIDTVTKELIRLTGKAKSGKLRGGTVVFDSLSDYWQFCQYWGKEQLAKAGRLDMHTSALKLQTDWSIINGQHYRMIMVLRNLLRLGVNVVSTARFQEIPDYVREKMSTTPTFESEIRAQKDAAFWFSTILKFYTQKQKLPDKQEVRLRYLSEIKKLETFDIKESDAIENLDFQKLKQIREKYREIQKGGE